jgi:hypothetical protein
MEYDHIGHTITANLATHTKHRHTRRAASRLPHSVIVITPPRASDSDFIGGFPDRASQTAPEPTPTYATNWPHAPRTNSSESDDELHKGIMLVLRRPRTLRTTCGRSSSPRKHRISDSIAAKLSRRTHQTRRVNRLTKSRLDPSSARAIIFAKLHTWTSHSSHVGTPAYHPGYPICMASSHLSNGYQVALMTHVMPTTLRATDWETFLVRTSFDVNTFLFLIKVFLQV